MTKVIYPGTFDPITNGHLDIIKRATSLFGEVIVAIAENSKKQPAFPFTERFSLAKKVLDKYPQVRVMQIDGLLIDFAKRVGAKAILRGLRAVSDFEYEFQLASMNRNLNNEIETVFLTPAEQYSYISATLVREIAELGGDISKFVPPEIIAPLQKLKTSR